MSPYENIIVLGLCKVNKKMAEMQLFFVTFAAPELK